MSRRKLPLSGYILDALQVLAPAEDLTVSEWAERHRVLDERSANIAGSWSNTVTPYLIEIMNEFNNPDTEEIVFCKPTQVGGTEAANNIIGYTVGQNPTPILIVYPSDKLGKWTSKNRLQPMFRRSSQLRERFHAGQSSLLELQFDGMYIALTGADSPSSLASRPIGVLILDEVDKYPDASSKEASPVALAKERTKTFPNRKIFMTSTPTTRGGNIWSAMEEADVIKHYFVPCPHCGEMIELMFSQLKWPSDEALTYSDRAEFASYVCQECGCHIQDRDKPGMLKNGQWKAVKENAKVHRSVAFWMNTLYSPFTRFSDVARAWLQAQADPDQLQNFYNSWLAEPWEDRRLRTSADLVLDRRVDVPALVVPDWAMLLTAGVDVQETGLYYAIRAWGKYITSQNITYGRVNGFEDIEYIMNQEYKTAKGEAFLVNLALVDSGDQTDTVYEFCIKNAEWALPCKGTSHSIGLHYYKISTLQKPLLRLVMVDGNKYKDAIAARMQREIGTGSYMFHADTDEDYAQQLTAEQKVSIRKGGRTVERWELKATHAANHYLDSEVYAYAAADCLGVRNLHLAPDEELARDDVPSPTQSNWLRGGAMDDG